MAETDALLAPDAFVVSPPFDADSVGDCIIQSSDGVQFKVVRAILTLASDVFTDMFGLPQPQDKSSDSITPIIVVTEDSLTLHALLMTISFIVCVDLLPHPCSYVLTHPLSASTPSSGSRQPLFLGVVRVSSDICFLP